MIDELKNEQQVALAIKNGTYSYQYMLNHTSKLKRCQHPDYEMFKRGVNLYTRMKKAAVSEFLRGWHGS
jgi:uncharacterized membrane protein